MIIVVTRPTVLFPGRPLSAIHDLLPLLFPVPVLFLAPFVPVLSLVLALSPVLHLLLLAIVVAWGRKTGCGVTGSTHAGTVDQVSLASLDSVNLWHLLKIQVSQVSKTRNFS